MTAPYKAFARGAVNHALLNHFRAKPANTPFNHTDVVSAILQELCTDPSARQRKAVRKSFYKLVERGYAVVLARGSWAFSEEGIRLAEAKAAGVRPGKPPSINADPPPKKGKPAPVRALSVQVSAPSPIPAGMATASVGTVFDSDISLQMKLRQAEDLNTTIVEVSDRVESIRKDNQAMLVDVQGLRRQLEHLKMDRAIAQATDTKRHLADQLSQALAQQTQIQNEMANLRAEISSLKGAEPTEDAEVTAAPEGDAGGDDDDEGGGDDDPDEPKPGIRQAPSKPRPNLTTKPKCNLTSKWLSKHLTPRKGQAESDLMRSMKVAVRSKCPVSATTGKVDDHVQEFLLKLVRRDGLSKKISAGQNVTYSHLASYAVRSAWTDARNAGTEPVERELYGARTERERREWKLTGKPAHNHLVRASDRIIWGGGDEGPSHIVGVVDATQPPDESFQQRKDFESMWARVEVLMKAAKPQAWERYAGILRMKYQGYTTGDIAAKENVSQHRAASMIQEAKSAIRLVGVEGLRA